MQELSGNAATATAGTSKHGDCICLGLLCFCAVGEGKVDASLLQRFGLVVGLRETREAKRQIVWQHFVGCVRILTTFVD